MDQQERDKILTASRNLEHRELTPEPCFDPYSDMTPEEKSQLIIELMSARQADRERIDSLMEKLDKMTECLLQSNEESRLLRSQLSDMDSLRRENAALKERSKLNSKHTYGSRSQKGITTKSQSSSSREKDKEDFDGTGGSISSDSESESIGPDPADTDKAEKDVKEYRLYRRGLEYRTMMAGKSVVHDSDKSRLPEGAVLIKTLSKYSYEQVSEIVEHRYNVFRYKMPDGRIYDGYFPSDGEPERIDMVPGTHASSSFLAYLAFNKYVLDTPLYRELSRIMDEDMHVNRMALTNWLAKGASYINGLVTVLKDKCLEKDSIVNCDETWCRVKVEDSYRKRYIWCLVNKQAKTVIYCYDEGSRGREVLRNILEDREIKSLQSDGYNVYMYLDDKLVDIEHLCCLAHARAKFKYAFEQSEDKDAEYILRCMGELYNLGREYETGLLTPEQIKDCRQGLRTKEILIRLRGKVDFLLSDAHPPRGELMEKALRYLDTFWPQLFAYLKDGSYSIDNSIAERFIRPLAGERKNSLFFGSDKMAEVSAAYHTVISTCRMQGKSVLDFLKSFFQEIVSGRRDYDRLLSLMLSGNN